MEESLYIIVYFTTPVGTQHLTVGTPVLSLARTGVRTHEDEEVIPTGNSCDDDVERIPKWYFSRTGEPSLGTYPTTTSTPFDLPLSCMRTSTSLALMHFPVTINSPTASPTP